MVLRNSVRQHHKKTLLKSRVMSEPALSLLARGYSNHQVASGLAHVRALEALKRAKELYTRTSFSGCVSLMAITETMMAPYLADINPKVERQSLELMARINLWLGICQWASGDHREAAAAFSRSANLPTNPKPDPQLFPPELIRAYATAIAAPQQEVNCQVDSRLSDKNLKIDGHLQLVVKGVMRLAAGTHYITIHGQCSDGDQSCESIQKLIGKNGAFSAHLKVTTSPCRVNLPPSPPSYPPVCANVQEAEDPAFIATLTRALNASGTLVTLLEEKKVSLRIQLGQQRSFLRQTVTRLEGSQSPAEIVADSLELLLQENGTDQSPTDALPDHQEWYKQWWVWAIIGGVVTATTITAFAVSSSSKNVRVVFGP